MKHGGKIAIGTLSLIGTAAVWGGIELNRSVDNDPTLKREAKIGDCLRFEGVPGGNVERQHNGQFRLYQTNELASEQKDPTRTIFVYEAPSANIFSHHMFEPEKQVQNVTPVERETLKSFQSCLATTAPAPK